MFEDSNSWRPPSSDPQQKTRTARERLSSLSLAAILLLSAGLYAVLMLRGDLPLAAFGLLALVWALHLYFDRGTARATPLDAPVLALLILLPINFIISADPPSTLVRIDHLLLSISLFFVIIRLVYYRRHLPMLIISLVILSIGAGLLGLIATDWSAGILGFLSPVYEKLPRLSSLIPAASINKNTMGGALTFFPPMLLSLLWDQSAFKKMVARYPGLVRFPVWFYKFLVYFALALVLAVIFLTQSRGAWLGTAVGLFAFLVWKDKRFLWALPFGAIALWVVLRESGIDSPAALLALLDRGQDASLTGRLNIWANVISMLRGFLLTGVGLDALNPVYQLYFSPFLFNEPPAALFHAHNTLLSVAIEMGIPVLVLFTALLAGFGAMARRAWKHARTINRVLIAGLVCGMLSHLVFGLMDAFPLGKNLGITLWIYLAVMTALYVNRAQMIHSFPHTQEQEAAAPKRALLRQLLRGLGAWLILSLLAVALCRLNIYVGLGAAVVAGVVLGVMLVGKPSALPARKAQGASAT